MQQVFYTQEGDAYILKCATKNIDNYVVAAPVVVEMRAIINAPPSGISFPFQYIELPNNPRPIVPLMYCFAATDISAGPFANVQVANIATPFYKFSLDNVFNYKHQPILSKVAPMIEVNAYNDNLNYNYGLKYGQAVLSTKDFLETTGYLNIIFVKNLGLALTNTQDIPVDLLNPIPAGTYRFAQTFLYFELQPGKGK